MSFEDLSVPLPGEYDIPDESELAKNKFWSLWGERADFSAEQFDALWTDASNQYTDELPWHNFGHAQRVLWDAMCLADICEANEIAVNRKVLLTAALLHDAGFHTDFMRPRFASKEEYSAAIFASLAPRYGLETSEIKSGQDAILSTALNGVPVTIEDKILGRADVMNVSGDYDTAFSPATARLMEEAEVLKETRVDRVGLRRHLIKALAGYLTRDLSLPFEEREWLEKPIANFRRLVAETAGEEHVPVPEFVRRLGGGAVTKLLSSNFSEDS